MKTWQKIALVIIAVVGVALCIKSCVDKKQPDLTMAYIGNGFVNLEKYEESVGELYDYCTDVNNDGEVVIDIMEISYNKELSQADKSNSSQKMTNAVGNGAARLYLIEEEYVKKNLDVGVFADLSDIAGDYDSVITNSSGEVVAIGVFGNEKVARLGIEPEKNLYLAVRKITEMDNVWRENVQEESAAAMNVAGYILED